MMIRSGLTATPRLRSRYAAIAARSSAQPAPGGFISMRRSYSVSTLRITFASTENGKSSGTRRGAVSCTGSARGAEVSARPPKAAKYPLRSRASA